MEIRANDRKAAAQRLAEITGQKAVYTRAPRFAYEVAGTFFEKDGTVTVPDGSDLEPLRTLATEGLLEPFGTEQAPENKKPAEGADEADSGVKVSLPLSAVNIENLTKLVKAKGSLIRKALGADNTRIEVDEKEQTVTFPWWDELPEPTWNTDEIAAHLAFISALCKMSREAKRVTAKEVPVDSEKYAFRCFLLRLGFIGPEHKKTRKVLLQKLDGAASFATSEKAEAFFASQKEKREAAKHKEEEE